MTPDPTMPAIRDRSPALRIFAVFLRLGLTSFGGPIAHLGYFRREFVERRQWLSEAEYADIVALCQFLPGPASSQVGFIVGLYRGGVAGGLAAWLGFTLPSAVLLFAAASTGFAMQGAGEGLLHGLKLVAVAVVAQAVWGMARSLTPDGPRAAIALCALALAGLAAGPFTQVAAIGLGALAGLVLCSGPAPVGGATAGDGPVSRRAGAFALAAYVLFLLSLPFASELSPEAAVADKFYGAGALVFGGGHVVLPLLDAKVVAAGWVSADRFLAGYGLAQAVPGPLFTFAAYLGASMPQVVHPAWGAGLALVMIFLPGLLLAFGALPFWHGLNRRPWAQAAMRGANAAVVGILAAALYDPLWVNAVRGPADFVLAAVGFCLLCIWHAPSWLVVLALPLASVLLSRLA